MDKTTRKNILLGFFVLIGISVFIVGIFLVGSKNELFAKTITVTSRFTNATGLKAGSNVRYNGVKVGIVKSVKLINDTLVQVDMQIEESKRQYILANAIASIASDGLMGDKIINIAAGQGQGEVIKNLDVIASSNPLIMDEVFQTLSRTNENVKVVTENLKNITGDITSGNGAIQMLYKDSSMSHALKQSINNLGSITGKVLDVSGSLQDIAAQIKDGDGTLGQLINDTTMGKDLGYTLANLKQASDALNTASGRLSQAIRRADSGGGTMNMLLSDTTFSSNLRKSVTSIKSASKGLDENMEALKHSFLTRGFFRKQAKKNRQKQN